ncbi:MAG: GntR family transcriptional regulator [Pseudomonadota bacterium]
MAIARPKSLTESVTEHLRAQIVSGELGLGEHLSERRLAEALEVSKTPVREALVQLRGEGLVQIIPQKGAVVFTLSAREVIEICEFRLALETAALRLALERDRKGLHGAIAAVVGRMEKAMKAGRTTDYLDLDTAFHAAFFAHCGNTYLRESYERYAGKIAALRTHLAQKPSHTRLSFDEHVRLRDVFADGTLEEVTDILGEHIGRTRATYAAEVEDIARADAERAA